MPWEDSALDWPLPENAIPFFLAQEAGPSEATRSHKGSVVLNAQDQAAQARLTPCRGTSFNHIQHVPHDLLSPFTVGSLGHQAGLTLASSVVSRSLMSLSRVQFIHSEKRERE